jgi:hypothetical protein
MATSAATAAPSIVKIPRVLVVDAVVTASAVLYPALLTIPQDADFEWWFLALSRTSNLLKLLLTEAGTSRALIFPGSQLAAGTQFLGVNVDNLAGTVQANGAFPIAVPYVMPASRTYTHQFSDTSGATNTVEVVYHGFALLAVPSAPGS